MKKRLSIYCIILIILYFSIGLYFVDTLKSYIIMYFYDKTQNNLLYKKEIDFYIPSGLTTLKKDWYPIMLHYDASQCFSNYIGKNISLNILYSFGAFDFLKGSSSFYNPSSAYYSAFYGGYAVFCNDDTHYGFDRKGNINIEEIQKVPMFDQTHLVLPCIGCPKDKICFQYVVKEIDKNIKYIGIDKWTKIDALIQTNAPIHKNINKKNIGYIQYGKPHKDFYKGNDYPIVTLKGRIYAKYIDKWKGTFFLYVIARDDKTLNACDKQLLSKSYICNFKKHIRFKY